MKYPHADIAALYDLINQSERPAILIGHGCRRVAGQQKAIRDVAEALQIPVLATWRAQGVFRRG